MNWENLREEQFKDAVKRSGGLCVLPMGCVEKHGQHLPLGTDTIAVRAVVEQAAEMEEVVVFPSSLWLGDLSGIKPIQDPFAVNLAGFICLNPRTLLTLLEELCDEMARNGFRKILIVNGHGGNKVILSQFLDMQAYAGKKYSTMTTFINDDICATATPFYEHIRDNRVDYPMITDNDLEVLKSYSDRPDGFGGGHGDFTETARILGIAPELVAPDRYDAEDGISNGCSRYLKKEGVDIGKNGWFCSCPNSLSGHPSFGCTETIGQAINLYAARRLARIFKMLKEDEECVRISQLLPLYENNTAD